MFIQWRLKQEKSFPHGALWSLWLKTIPWWMKVNPMRTLFLNVFFNFCSRPIVSFCSRRLLCLFGLDSLFMIYSIVLVFFWNYCWFVDLKKIFLFLVTFVIKSKIISFATLVILKVTVLYLYLLWIFHGDPSFIR